MKDYFKFRWAFSALFVLALTHAAWPHEGEVHSGESLATSGNTSLGVPIHIPKPTQFLLGIETARVTEVSVPRRLKTLGQVSIPTNRQADVHSPFQGLLQSTDGFSVPVRGTYVEKGDTLALVEQVISASETLSVITEISKTESALNQSREEARLASTEFERVKKLGESVSGRRLAEAESAAVISEQKVKGLARALEEMRQAVSVSRDNPRVVAIKAPISGVIAASHVTPGEFIEPQKLLFEIIDSSQVWVEAKVYEMDLPLVEDAVRAKIVCQVYPDQDLSGKLSFISQRSDPGSRTVKTVFDVVNVLGCLREGMFVTVYIETAIKETGPMLPKAAIVNTGGQSVVYVKVGPETFVPRAVEVKGIWGENAMVASGLSPGEIVVVQGTYQVRTSAR